MHAEFTEIVGLAPRAGWQQTGRERCRCRRSALTRRLRGPRRRAQHHHSRIHDRRTRLINHATGNDAAALQGQLEVVNTIAALQLDHGRRCGSDGDGKAALLRVESVPAGLDVEEHKPPIVVRGGGFRSKRKGTRPRPLEHRHQGHLRAGNRSLGASFEHTARRADCARERFARFDSARAERPMLSLPMTPAFVAICRRIGPAAERHRPRS